mmetsp:Transcript_6392/g.16402  ORF Transcript_6392/g.16402 Transcript_6392/m.16402 type:complete len:254 (-) Transcript_6392:36-797(-)
MFVSTLSFLHSSTESSRLPSRLSDFTAPFAAVTPSRFTSLFPRIESDSRAVRELIPSSVVTAFSSRLIALRDVTRIDSTLSSLFPRRSSVSSCGRQTAESSSTSFRPFSANCSVVSIGCSRPPRDSSLLLDTLRVCRYLSGSSCTLASRLCERSSEQSSLRALRGEASVMKLSDRSTYRRYLYPLSSEISVSFFPFTSKRVYARSNPELFGARTDIPARIRLGLRGQSSISSFSSCSSSSSSTSSASSGSDMA